jgi:hypothetical protein
MHGRLLAVASAALVTLVLAGVAAAGADNTVVDDNRNVTANRLDIEQARAGHNGDQLQHTIITYRPWRTGILRSNRARPRAACIYIWRAGRNINERQNYEVCARVRKNKLRAYVWKVRPKRTLEGRVDVKRFDLNSITFNFAPSLIGNPKLYRWQAVTGFTGKGCPRDPPYQFGCDDSAPTRGAVPYDLSKPAEPPA